MPVESFKSVFAKSIMSGVLIGIGGIVYLSVENKYLGAFLFSLGLFTIIQFGFSLYTGKVGYIPEKPVSYIKEVAVTLLGNVFGTAFTAAAVFPTHIRSNIHEKAVSIISTKISDSFLSQVILGFFCGMLMYIAVENGRVCRKKGYDTSAVFGTVLPVMVFILCGFNHSVADCFYFFAADFSFKGALYILIVAVGNALGGMTIPLIKKLFDKQNE